MKKHRDGRPMLPIMVQQSVTLITNHSPYPLVLTFSVSPCPPHQRPSPVPNSSSSTAPPHPPPPLRARALAPAAGRHRPDSVVSVQHRCASRASARLPHPDTGGAAPELGRPSPDGVPRRCARILLHLPVRTQELGHPSLSPHPPRLHPVRPSSPSRQSPAHLDMPSPRAPSGIGNPRGTGLGAISSR